VPYGDNKYGFLEARYLSNFQPDPTASILSVPRQTEPQMATRPTSKKASNQRKKYKPRLVSQGFFIP
jgi:hypothetical protein